MNTIIIGIAGGTGSGKTTLTERLRDHFGIDEVSVINHDSYYKRHDELPYEERCKLNYDHPDSFDTPLMVATCANCAPATRCRCPCMTTPSTTAATRLCWCAPRRSSSWKVS